MSSRDLLPRIRVRHLGEVDYLDAWQKMQAYTDARTPDSDDEIWLLSHPAVYTLGKNAKPEHILDAGEIPVINSDRGGQVTYHGPGQLVAYILFDIARAKIGVRQLVTIIEQSIIDLLADYGVTANARADAPGVYVNDAKIAALGLRVRKGRSFHGLSLNIDMDLEPFSRINPCGYQDLQVTQMSEQISAKNFTDVSERLLMKLIAGLKSC
jgi:lipoyl(octanoyl) transferase